MARGAPVTDEAPHDSAGPPASASAPAPPRAPAAPPPERRPTAVHSGSIAVLLIGLLITVSLSVGAQSLRDSNEQRLLRQRGKEVAAVITAAIPDLQTPLATAAAVAAATDGSAASFRGLMQPMVGPPPARFVTASLWLVSSDSVRRVVTVGVTPTLAGESADAIARVLRPPASAGTVVINDLLTRDRRVGYGYAAPGSGPHYVVYVESALPTSRRSRVDSNSAFADLDYALFLGTKPRASQLLASSTGGVLLHGRQESEIVPFGDGHILLVVQPSRELGGDLLARLPWALAIGGLLLSLAATFLVDNLLRRRDHAEALARENDQLYREQRSVAQVLQHSLLPSTLPDIAGLALAARYVAGADDVDIGGDWYDIVIRDDGRVVFVVGDVSGRGLRAATTMAELRYAFRAYATQGDPPETILAKVSRLIDVGRDGHFATAVCGSIDVASHRLDLANAGHPDPVLVAGGDARFVAVPIGAPLGVAKHESYSAVSVSIPMGATVLAYTDGLVERRGEHLDTGRERLRSGALDTGGSLDDQLARIVAHTIPEGSSDDTAILGLRWLS